MVYLSKERGAEDSRKRVKKVTVEMSWMWGREEKIRKRLGENSFFMAF